MKSRKLLVETLESRAMLSVVVGSPCNAEETCFKADLSLSSSGVLAPPAVAFDSVPVATPQAITRSAGDAARDALLDGVSQIARDPLAPGVVAVFDPPGATSGEGAFGVISDSQNRTLVAGSLVGQGRVVAFGHLGYLNFSEHAGKADTGTLYSNATSWAAGTTDRSITVVTSESSARDWLQAEGYTDVRLQSAWYEHLQDADLVIAPVWASSANDTAVLSAATQIVDYVNGGGALVTGGLGWRSVQLGFDLPTEPGNVVMREFGLSWSSGFLPSSGPPLDVARASHLANASEALVGAQSFWEGGELASAEQAVAFAAFEAIREVLPETHPLRNAVNEAFTGRALALSATPATPVQTEELLDRAVLRWEAEHLATATPAELNGTPHHTAELVYGEIPADADRSERVVSVDTSKSRWLSTGLYVPPGELVSVTVSSALLAAAPELRVRISGHTDDISAFRDQAWSRLPFGVSREYAFDGSQTVEVASAFGGALYLDVGNSAPGIGRSDVLVEGAIEAPYFVLGETSDEAWRTYVRDYPAPYAELVTDRVAISAPSAWVRSLQDPTDLLTLLDEGYAFADEVAALDGARTAPERINVDVQISNGLLHAGYPIQGASTGASGDRSRELLDLETLFFEGNWGYFHEYGHELQRGPGKVWGTTNPYTLQRRTPATIPPGADLPFSEVTVNIFANAALERVAREPSDPTWGWSADPAEVMTRAASEVNRAEAGSFAGRNPYPFYFQLADGFGWEKYREVLDSYNRDYGAGAGLPTTDGEKLDEWYRRWSAATGYDMTQFMVGAWGLEVSQQAVDDVAALALPGWMPIASTLPELRAVPGVTQIIDLGSAAQSLDGVAALVSVTQPEAGSLVALGGGLYRYTPNGSLTGVDRFEATYRSSAGNTQTFQTRLQVTDGLLGWWSLDDADGASLSDSGVAGAEGVRVGAEWVPGRFGGSALSFDGVDDYAALGRSASLDGVTDFTVSAWIKTEADGVIVQQRDRDGFDGEYWLSVNSEGKLNFFVYGAGFEQFDVTTQQAVNDGVWRHVVAQRQGREARVYVDGVLAASTTSAESVAPLDDAISVAIGADVRDGSRHFSGLIDEVRVYDQAIEVRAAGDYNADGSIDEADYNVWAAAFGERGFDRPADGNGDGVVDAADYTVWRDAQASAASAASVRETVGPADPASVDGPSPQSLRPLSARSAVDGAARRPSFVVTMRQSRSDDSIKSEAKLMLLAEAEVFQRQDRAASPDDTGEVGSDGRVVLPEIDEAAGSGWLRPLRRLRASLRSAW